MINTQKLEKFVQHLEDLVLKLHTAHDLAIHHEINDAYYMEKIAEMRLLQAQLTESIHHLYLIQSRIQKHYKVAYCCWRRDARWLCRYLRETHRIDNIHPAMRYNGQPSPRSS